MSYQPLTREQYEAARQKFSHDQIMQMENTRKAQTAAPTTPAKKEPNALQQIGQSAVGSLLVRPAARTTEALGRLGVFGENIKQGYEHNRDIGRNQTFNMPGLGVYEINDVKAGTAAAKQILGESLEAASWIYGPTKAVSVAKNLPGQVMSGAKFLGGHGAVAGGMYGAGTEMQEEDSTAGSIAMATGRDAAFGAAGGAAFGAALPLIKPAAGMIGGAMGAARGMAETGVGLAKGAAGFAKRGVEGAGKIPLRVGDRTLEAIKKSAARQEIMKNATPQVKMAMKEGVPDEWISMTTTGSGKDKTVRSQMVDIAKAYTDPTYTGTGDLPTIGKPSQIVGDTINDGPVKFLLQTKKQALKGTSDIIEALPEVPQNFRNLFDQFIQDMNMAGVVVKNGQLTIKQGSRVAEGDLKFYTQVYNDLKPDAKLRTNLTYKQLHELRQKWFDIAGLEEGYTKGPKSYARRLRSFLSTEINEGAAKYIDDDTLKTFAPDGEKVYSAAQIKTREALGAIQEYAKLLGYKGDLEKIGEKSLKGGEVSMRTLGNAADKALSTIHKLYKAAKKYGYKVDENIINLIRFADMAEDVYGVPTRSIGGLVARASNVSSDPGQVAASSVREMVKWSPYSGSIRAARAAGLLGKREQDIITAFEQLVKAEVGGEFSSIINSPIREALKNIFKTGKQGIDDAVTNIKDDFNTGAGRAFDADDVVPTPAAGAVDDVVPTPAAGAVDDVVPTPATSAVDDVVPTPAAGAVDDVVPTPAAGVADDVSQEADIIAKFEEGDDYIVTARDAVEEIRAVTKNPEIEAAIDAFDESIESTFRDYGGRMDLEGDAFEELVRVINDVKKRAGGKARSEISPTTPINKAKEIADFERLPLQGESADIQEASIRKYVENKAELVDEYISRFGYIANADEARKLFTDVGYRGSNPQAVHEASSRLAKDIWEKGLQQPGKYADIYAGGAGAGKTSSIKKVVPGATNSVAAVLDGTLSKFSSFERAVNQARKAGKIPRVMYVYRDPFDSFENGMIVRALGNKDEMGRVVPIKEFIKGHKGSMDTLRRALDEAEYPDVEFWIVDNSRGPNPALVDDIYKLPNTVYNVDESSLSAIAEQATKPNYKYGQLTKEQIKSILGKE